MLRLSSHLGFPLEAQVRVPYTGIMSRQTWKGLGVKPTVPGTATQNNNDNPNRCEATAHVGASPDVPHAIL